jgi:3'-5' exonuclease
MFMIPRRMGGHAKQSRHHHAHGGKGKEDHQDKTYRHCFVSFVVYPLYSAAMLHKRLFIFDIETVPDWRIVKNLTGETVTGLEDGARALEQYHLALTDGKNGFPRQPFHQVVAISFVEAEIEVLEGGHERYHLLDLRSGGTETSTEEELLQGFFKYLGHHRPRLVTFNGRTFDLPVLKYRAMRHLISAPWLHLGGDKWNSYNSRYSLDWHCDLLEAFSDFGTSARVKMHEVCAAFNIPGKLDTAGDDVLNLYAQGQIKAIRDYCECDVLSTWLLYLRFMQHRGTLKNDDYLKGIESTEQYLLGEQEGRGHLERYLAAWQSIIGVEGRIECKG